MILFLLNRKKYIAKLKQWCGVYGLSFLIFFFTSGFFNCLRRTRALVWFFVYFSPLPPGTLTFFLLLPSCRRLSKTHISRVLTSSTPCPDGRKPSQDPSFPQPSIASSLSALIGKANARSYITDVWTHTRASVGRRLLRSQLASPLWLELHLLWPRYNWIQLSWASTPS